MKLPTTDSLINGFPLVIATQTQQPTARLLLRNTQGQVVQQWLVKQNKCTLGSAASCSLRCQLSGVAPYHALLVIGARQIFIRALAPKLTRDGRPFNELLLTDDDSHFELAGHRFELTRNYDELRKAARPENSSPERIKFTLARPFELRNRPQSNQLPYSNEKVPNTEPANASMSGTDSKWVAQLIQAAMQPLECQLHNLIEPLNELQHESRKQRRLRKKRALRKRNSPKSETRNVEASSLQTVSQQFAQQVDEIVGRHTASIQTVVPQFAQQVDEIVGKHAASIQSISPQFAQQVDEIVGKHTASIQSISPQFAQQVDEIVGKHAASIQTLTPQFAQQVEEIVGKHTASVQTILPQFALQAEGIESKHALSMEVLTERILEVNHQLSSIERIVAQEHSQSQDPAATLPSDSSQLELQNEAIEQLQLGIVTVSSALEQLQVQQTDAREDDQQWKASLHSQLEGLIQLIDGLSTSVAEVHHVALRAATQPPTIQPVPIQPAATNQAWPTENGTTHQEWTTEEIAIEDRSTEENASVEGAVANPFSLGTFSDSLVQDEFHFAGDAMDVDPVSREEPVTDAYDAADDFDEFSQLWSQSDSNITGELIDNREPEKIEASGRDEVDHEVQRVDQHSAEESPLVSAQEDLLSSRQHPEIKVFQCKLPKGGVTATEMAKSKVTENEVAESDVAERDVAEKDVAENDVAENEVAESELDTTELNESELTEKELAEKELTENVVAESEVATSEVAVERKPTAVVSAQPSSSLPSWWVDDESEDDSANLPFAQQAIGSPNGYDSVPEPIGSDSEQARSPASVDELSRDEEPSEEFFGLAQLDLEDHLREAEPMPSGVAHNLHMEIAEENNPEPDVDEELLGFGESFVAHPNPTPVSTLPLEPTSDFSSELVAELPAVEELDDVAVAAVEDSSSSLPGVTHADAEEVEDDSVEDYMRKLLARMRGVPEDEVELPNRAAAVATATQSGSSTAPADRPEVAVHPRAHIERPMPSQEPESEGPATAGYDPATQAISAEVTEPFDPEKYMPRALAPERSKSLAAMRELANSSARTAIHKSTRQRHVSGILLKAVIAIVGLLVGTVLVAINGLSMNIGLFATVASFMVATVWGYDAISSIRPMLQNGLVLKPQASPQVERAQSEEQDSE